MEHLVERRKYSEKIDFHVHDNDGVTRKVIEKSKWKYLSQGMLLSLKKKQNHLIKKKGFHSLFRNTALSTDERVDLYYNMPNHYQVIIQNAFIQTTQY